MTELFAQWWNTIGPLLTIVITSVFIAFMIFILLLIASNGDEDIVAPPAIILFIILIIGGLITLERNNWGWPRIQVEQEPHKDAHK